MSEIKSNNKRIVKNTVILYFKSIFLILISLYISRVVLQALGVEDFGIYNIVGGVVAMFAMLNSSMSAASQRFMSYSLGEHNAEKLNKVFSTSVILHVILGLIVVILVEVIGVWFLYHILNIPEERIDVAFWVLQFSAATVFVNVNTIPYNAVFLAHESMAILAYITVLNGIMKLMIAISLLWTTRDRLIFYAFLMLVVSILTWGVYFLCSRRCFEETKHIRFTIYRRQFKEMFGFVGWHLLGSSANVLKKQGVDVLLNLFFGVTVNAAKSLSNQVFSAAELFVSNLQTAISPQLTAATAQNDSKRIHWLIIHGCRMSFCMVTILAVPMIISAPQILSIWLVNVPPYTVEFVRWLFIYLLLDTFSRFLLSAIVAHGRIKKYEIVVGGTKLLIIPFAYVWLCFGGGPLICVWATLIIELFCLSERLYFNHLYNGISYSQFLLKVIVRCCCVLIIAISFSLLIKTYLITNYILITIASIICSIVTILCIGLNRSERAWIKKKIYATY